MILSSEISGVGLDAAFLQAGRLVGQDFSKAVYLTGARVRTQVRANASGRPGPRVQTGDYRRSISQENTRDGVVPVAYVFTNSPQALRLEYGFRGADALGRVFNQPPYPHWRPAMDKAGQWLAEAAELTVKEALARFASTRTLTRIVRAVT